MLLLIGDYLSSMIHHQLHHRIIILYEKVNDAGGAGVCHLSVCVLSPFFY